MGRLGQVDIILYRYRNDSRVDLFGCISGPAILAESGSHDIYSVADLPAPVQTIGILLCHFGIISTVSRYGMTG